MNSSEEWKDLLLELGIIISHPGFTSSHRKMVERTEDRKSALTRLAHVSSIATGGHGYLSLHHIR